MAVSPVPRPVICLFVLMSGFYSAGQRGALPGIIRGALLEMAMIDGLQIEEAPIDMARLEKADALYVSNSVNGVVAAAFVSRWHKKNRASY